MRTYYLNLLMDYSNQAEEVKGVMDSTVSKKPVFGYDLAYKIDIDKVGESFEAPAPKSLKSPGTSYTAENFSALARLAREDAEDSPEYDFSLRETLGDEKYEEYLEDQARAARIYMLWGAREDKRLELLHVSTVDVDSTEGWSRSFYTTVFRNVIERKKKTSPGMEYRWGYVRVPRGLLY